ncbi:MAG: hypothetical protein WDM80_07170 [Limisphaerales bacterium]
MNLIYKEDPKEWRKSTWLTALGLAVVSSLLRWRRHLSTDVWCAVLVVLTLVAVIALMKPRWFRGWYRVSLWLGFYSSQFVGRCVLLLFFIFIITPVGWMLRLAGKDPLQLRKPHDAKSYWLSSKDCSPLDRLF